MQETEQRNLGRRSTFFARCTVDLDIATIDALHQYLAVDRRAQLDTINNNPVYRLGDLTIFVTPREDRVDLSAYSHNSGTPSGALEQIKNEIRLTEVYRYGPKEVVA